MPPKKVAQKFEKNVFTKYRKNVLQNERSQKKCREKSILKEVFSKIEIKRNMYLRKIQRSFLQKEKCKNNVI